MPERVILVPENPHERLREYTSFEKAREAIETDRSAMVFLFDDERTPNYQTNEGIFLKMAYRLMTRLLEYETPNANPTQ